MSMRKVLTVFGLVIFLGSGFLAAAGQNQAQGKNQALSKAQIKTMPRMQNRLMFMDENGDGICDSFRDHDNDGIPNGQDPDWMKPKDGTGNQSRFNKNDSSGQNGVKNGFRSANKWSKQAFRRNKGGNGSGVCSLTGSKGNARKGGNR